MLTEQYDVNRLFIVKLLSQVICISSQVLSSPTKSHSVLFRVWFFRLLTPHTIFCLTVLFFYLQFPSPVWSDYIWNLQHAVVISSNIKGNKLSLCREKNVWNRLFSISFPGLQSTAILATKICDEACIHKKQPYNTNQVDNGTFKIKTKTGTVRCSNLWFLFSITV